MQGVVARGDSVVGGSGGCVGVMEAVALANGGEGRSAFADGGVVGSPQSSVKVRFLSFDGMCFVSVLILLLV